MIMVWDVDRDQWFGVTTEFVLNNCHRFDPATGMPYGLKHTEIDRHDVEYSASQFDDSYGFFIFAETTTNYRIPSYHYTIKEGARTIRKPCIFLGQIDQKHIPLSHIIQKGGEHTVMKMRDLKAANISSGVVRTAVAQARALLIRMESVFDNANVLAYLGEALPASAPKIQTNSASVFGANYLKAFQPINTAFGGVDLPMASVAVATGGPTPPWLTAARALAVPVGFGSYSGFKAIEARYNEVGKNDDAFTRRTGIDSAVARTVVGFLAVFEAFVSYATAFFPHSLGVDVSQAAPWWLGATPAHAIFDAVVTPQHRLPVLRRTPGSNPATYQSTPIVYTPNMARGVEFYGNDIRLLNPANVLIPLAQTPAGLEEAIGLGDVARFAALDSALVPISPTFESPAVTGSVLNNYLRMIDQKAANRLGDTGADVGDRTMMDDEVLGLARDTGKRSSSSMAAGGRVLASFGGGGGGAPAAVAGGDKRIRAYSSTPNAALGNLAKELQNDNLITTWDQVDADKSIDELEKWSIKRTCLCFVGRHHHHHVTHPSLQSTC